MAFDSFPGSESAEQPEPGRNLRGGKPLLCLSEEGAECGPARFGVRARLGLTKALKFHVLQSRRAGVKILRCEARRGATAKWDRSSGLIWAHARSQGFPSP